MNKLVKMLFVLTLIVSCSPKDTNKTPLTIQTQNGPVEYMVEEAITHDQMESGYMNRESIDANSGMIFNIDPARRIAMWMKDTKVSLDMIFVGNDGTIIQVYENAEPMSENKIISEAPVRAVIEINAGDIKKNNIKVGDKITHEFFQKTETPAQSEPVAETKTEEVAE